MIRALLTAALVGVCAASCFVVAVAVAGVVSDWWRDRRHARWDAHCDQALAVVRHPSARPVGPEDSAAWAARWGVGRP